MRAAIGVLVAASFAVATPVRAGLNDPFGPELACFAELKKAVGAELLQTNRFKSEITSQTLPVSVNDEGPSIGLETVNGKSTHLRIFTETGEFEADFDVPTNGIAVCIDGVGFPSGTGSALYLSKVSDFAAGRFGTLTNYRQFMCKPDKDKPAPIKARQVGESGQAASRKRLDTEMQLMLSNVNSATKERKIDPSLSKGALQRCVVVLQGDSLKLLRAQAERQLGFFDKKAAQDKAVTDTTANPTR